MQSSKVMLLNGVDGNSLHYGVYAFNKMLKFGVGGDYIGEFPFSYRNSRLREIDLISIINVENDMEVAFVINEEMGKLPICTDIYKILEWCNDHPAICFSGRRKKTHKGLEFTQYFYGFTKNRISEEEIKRVFSEE